MLNGTFQKGIGFVRLLFTLSGEVQEIRFEKKKKTLSKKNGHKFRKL